MLDDEIGNSGEDLDQFLQSIGYGYLMGKLRQLGCTNILELAQKFDLKSLEQIVGSDAGNLFNEL